MSAPVGKKYFVANNLNSNRAGFHWVAVVYEIKASSGTPLFVPLEQVQAHHINTRINFDADADFNSSSYCEHSMIAKALLQPAVKICSVSCTQVK